MKTHSPLYYTDRLFCHATIVLQSIPKSKLRKYALHSREMLEHYACSGDNFIKFFPYRNSQLAQISAINIITGTC